MGGWSNSLKALLIFVVIDYVSGFFAACKEGKLSSQVGMMGITKKVMVFALIAVVHLIDTSLGNQHLFRDGTVLFYLVNEVLSILENVGRMGLPIPPQLQKGIEILWKRKK
ncbi:toxin secretion/phage lysis holin [Laceyella tengchongensis]|uniref:Toxin secretion/phage lysis holin n=1 Tax=Laceyella tengchongensis TaxID=574699 RepID=A0AA45WRU4_9BACL|nr:phage holin family protein [Laceyella tengchongensis]SMP32730.1 toxin secretion/phage lysis holin [Laceyella tengchongensis]